MPWGLLVEYTALVRAERSPNTRHSALPPQPSPISSRRILKLHSIIFADLPGTPTFSEKMRFCSVYYRYEIPFPTKPPMMWNLPDIGNALD